MRLLLFGRQKGLQLRKKIPLFATDVTSWEQQPLQVPRGDGYKPKQGTTETLPILQKVNFVFL